MASPPEFEVGMRFLPTDTELVRHYLYRKITGQPLPEGLILECDLYGKENPWEIWERYGEKCVKTVEGEDLYFYTLLKRKNPQAKRVQRKVGLGSWEGENHAMDVMASMDDGTEQCVGFKKRFRFEKSGTDQDGGWILHEYTLSQSLLPPGSKMNDYVLCRMRKNEKNLKKTNKRKTLELKDTCASLLESGLKPKKLKDNKSENTPSIQSVEELLNEEDSFSPNQPFLFGTEKQSMNFEPENKEENPCALLGEEDDLGLIWPILSMPEDQEVYFGEETFWGDDNSNFWFAPFFEDLKHVI